MSTKTSKLMLYQKIFVVPFEKCEKKIPCVRRTYNFSLANVEEHIVSTMLSIANESVSLNN